MSNPLIERVEKHDYQDLFLKDLQWSRPTRNNPIALTTENGQVITAKNISSYKGVSVWVCDQQPGPALEAQLDRLISKESIDRLTIFHNEQEQVWRWPVRQSKGAGTSLRLSRHRYRSGQDDLNFAQRLEKIRIDWDHPIDATGLVTRVREAFDVEAQKETRNASKLMARMYEALKACGTGEHEISVTLARILFLMFGDDTEMWEADLFQRFVTTQTKLDGSDLAERLNELCAWLDTSDKERAFIPKHLAGFKYINGGIFVEKITLPALSADFRKVVLEASARDWTTISPAIFGSMFQSVRDAETRRALGEHYTSEENILKTLNPLFLDELRSDFEIAKTMKNEGLALRKLRDRLGEIHFLDPACGCGNFIIIAYRELRDLELQIMERLQELTGESPSLMANYGLKVNLDNFYGIEIDEWPAKIAETAMFLMDRQADLKLIERLGWAPDRLPIQRQATIISGRSALKEDWTLLVKPSENVIVAGNPPFIGISMRSESQTEELQEVWGSRYHGTLDYVTGWHAKCLEYFRGVSGRWAFVATNSITQGEAVAPLFQPILDAGWKIKFAHRTFPWTSEATDKAVVHCVIIGFAKGKVSPRLFDYPFLGSAPQEQPEVDNISPYLTNNADLLVVASTKPISPQMGEVIYGNKPTDGGFLMVEPEEVDAVRTDAVAAKYLRKCIGAKELLHGTDRYCFWLTNLHPGDEAKSPILHGRIDGVRKFRTASKALSTRNAAATSHLFRQISQPTVPYLCIPRHVSEARPYFLSAWYGPEVITSDANFLAPDKDGFTFAIISSAMFMAWQRAVGGRIKSDLRFNKLLSWNTFPLPTVTTGLKQEIIDAGRRVADARELTPTKSLAEQYAPGAMDQALLAAHITLDALVDKAFNVTTAIQTDQQRQTVLFRSYQDLTADLVTLAAAKPKKSRSRAAAFDRSVQRDLTNLASDALQQR